MQIECWNTYVGALTSLPTILLIDDGSPQTSAAALVRQHGCQIPIKVFRIKEDIPWNCAGARNLGCWHAEEWIYVSDIDTLLWAKDAQRLFELHPLEQRFFYRPRRIRHPSAVKCRPSKVNLLFHKDHYLRIGGYDEDYAGHYGKEETDFFTRMKGVAQLTERPDVVIRAVSAGLVLDAETSALPRDASRNELLFESKKSYGWIKPLNPFRFTWEQVYQS